MTDGNPEDGFNPEAFSTPEEYNAFVANWRQDVELKSRANDQMIADIRANHMNVDQGSLALVRVITLAEHILGNLDTPARLAYEQKVQDLFAEQLAPLAAKVRQMRLAAGTAPSGPARGGIILPGRG